MDRSRPPSRVFSSGRRSRSLQRPSSRQSSRSVSPGQGSRRVAKLNLYLSNAMSRRASSGSLAGKRDSFYACPNGRTLKQWLGQERCALPWDGIRRDPDLWMPNGDCYVYLHERGSSRRGPSFRLLLADIVATGCEPLFNHYCNTSSPRSSTGSNDVFVDAPEYASDAPIRTEYDLYIPAPAHLSREDALNHHVTTRNVFAWMYGLPLVGEKLGRSLIALYQRIRLERSPLCDNYANFLEYLEDQQYTDFRDSPDHALAILQVAEYLQHRDLWTDAFVHCVGMNDRLDTSEEIINTSKASQALITRARIEMHIRLDRAGLALGSFLDGEVPGTYMGLSREARVHLEHFRSFLQSYYVCEYGYWPPARMRANEDAFPKHVYEAMHSDFRLLYAYLADVHFETGRRPVDGGICVFQNLLAFDERHKYPSLPRPLPLVPKIPEVLHRKWPRLKLFSKSKETMERRLGACSALVAATNSYDSEIMSNGLVREYLAFEKDCVMADDKSLSCADARKVRWILIYAILQTLISVTRIPEEVRDADDVGYPLCCQTAGTPPWSLDEDKADFKADSKPAKRKSLREHLLDIGPDLDLLKPQALNVIQRPPLKTLRSNSRSSSFIKKISLRRPSSTRSRSTEFLAKDYSSTVTVDWVPRQSPSEITLPLSRTQDQGSLPRTQDVGSTLSVNSVATRTRSLAQKSFTSFASLEGNPRPLASHPPDVFVPPTPSSTSPDQSTSGWSTDDGVNDMEHASVASNDSNYGDDEDEGSDDDREGLSINFSKPLPSTVPMAGQPGKGQSKPQRPKASRLPSDGSMKQSNPEVDVFLKA